MICLKRLSGKEFVLNSDLILSVEGTPDTVITLQGGEKLMVLESVAEVVRLATEYRKRVAQEPPESGTAAQAANLPHPGNGAWT